MQVFQTLKKILEANSMVKVTQENDKKYKEFLTKLQTMLTIGGIGFEEDRKKYR